MANSCSSVKIERMENFGVLRVTFVQRIWRYLSGLVFGFIAAWVISTVVARVWPGARLIVLIVLVGIWLSGFAQILVRDLRAGGEGERAVFARPEDWDPSELPREFRFITHETTVNEVVEKVGEYTRVTQSGLVRYDLPSGGALFLYPEAPFSGNSRVRGIQLYRTEDEVPPFT